MIWSAVGVVCAEARAGTNSRSANRGRRDRRMSGILLKWALPYTAKPFSTTAMCAAESCLVQPDRPSRSSRDRDILLLVMPIPRVSRPSAAILAALMVHSLLPPALAAQMAEKAAVTRAFPSDSAVLAIIRQRVEEKRSVGIVVGILEPDGRTRIVAFGDPGPGKPTLDGSSVFEIGSISKVFTATVLAELVKEGKVTLDDPVQKFLPASVHVPSRNGKQITLGNLSEQNSRLPRLPSNFHPKD